MATKATQHDKTTQDQDEHRQQAQLSDERSRAEAALRAAENAEESAQGAEAAAQAAAVGALMSAFEARDIAQREAETCRALSTEILMLADEVRMTRDQLMQQTREVFTAADTVEEMVGRSRQVIVDVIKDTGRIWSSTITRIISERLGQVEQEARTAWQSGSDDDDETIRVNLPRSTKDLVSVVSNSGSERPVRGIGVQIPRVGFVGIAR